MKQLNHKWVDVMKVDIEGAEWGFLQHLVTRKVPLPFTQLQVGGIILQRAQYLQAFILGEPALPVGQLAALLISDLHSGVSCACRWSITTFIKAT